MFKWIKPDAWLRPGHRSLSTHSSPYSPIGGNAGSCPIPAIGIVAAVIIRQILAASGIHDYIVAPLLAYAGLAVSATLLAWLLWFGH
jgi:hypothetical protein